MKVTFCTRDYAKLSGGHNTWLCRFPTVRSLRQAGFSCTTVSEKEIKYTEQRVRWIFNRLMEDPPDVFVINAVYPAAYYAGRWLREAGIPTVGICHVGPVMGFGLRLCTKVAGTGGSRTGSQGNFDPEHSLRGSDSRKCGEKTERPAEVSLLGATGCGEADL